MSWLLRSGWLVMGLTAMASAQTATPNQSAGPSQPSTTGAPGIGKPPPSAAALPPSSAAPTPPLGASAASLPSAAAAPVRSARASSTPSATCIERIPESKKRPPLEETFPSRGVSGHASTLSVVVQHLKGEEVLPGGFEIAEGDALQALERAEWVLPDPEGGAGPVINRSAEGTETEVRIPLVPLPAKPGRHELTLPPLPITLARANGQVITVCTQPHEMIVEDPIANQPDPKPKHNPPARRQLEEWVLLKQLVYGGLMALAVGVVAAWLFSRWRRRPKPAVPPPPPRPPWEVALEELHDVRHAGLIKAGRFSEHFDRVSDAIRNYLGERFGFDGLESTTREALGVLDQVTPPIVCMDQIRAFMRQADLVKFAGLTPTEDECEHALSRGEEIVRSTMPRELATKPREATSPGGVT